MREKIEKLEIKEKIAPLEITILVLQQSLDIGQRVKIIGGSWRVGDLCEVTDVKLKSVWVIDVDGTLFLKKKYRMVIESPLPNAKNETDAYKKWRKVIYSKR